MKKIIIPLDGDYNPQDISGGSFSEGKVYDHIFERNYKAHLTKIVIDGETHTLVFRKYPDGKWQIDGPPGFEVHVLSPDDASEDVLKSFHDIRGAISKVLVLDEKFPKTVAITVELSGKALRNNPTQVIHKLKDEDSRKLKEFDTNPSEYAGNFPAIVIMSRGKVELPQGFSIDSKRPPLVHHKNTGLKKNRIIQLSAVMDVSGHPVAYVDNKLTVVYSHDENGTLSESSRVIDRDLYEPAENEAENDDVTFEPPPKQKATGMFKDLERLDDTDEDE